MTTEESDPELILSFRTLAGNVAASINWNCAAPPAGLPQAVLEGIKSSGFKCPLEPLRDMSPEAAPLAEQLASMEP